MEGKGKLSLFSHNKTLMKVGKSMHSSGVD